jgi:hypothetical protein
MSLDDRDGYREAIREQVQQQDPPAPPRPAARPRGQQWEPSWLTIAPLALIAGGLASVAVFQFFSRFGGQ